MRLLLHPDKDVQFDCRKSIQNKYFFISQSFLEHFELIQYLYKSRTTGNVFAMCVCARFH